MFEKQVYPDRRNANGEAEVPYDVAGLDSADADGRRSGGRLRDTRPRKGPLRRCEQINDINRARSVMNLPARTTPFQKQPNPLKSNPAIGLYQTIRGSMDEGWTRLVLDTFQIPYRTVTDKDLKRAASSLDSLILPADRESTMIRGLSAERYPAEISGGTRRRGRRGAEEIRLGRR